MDYDFPIIFGMSSSQLTIRHIFQRGRAQPPTRSLLTIINHIITIIINHYYQYMNHILTIATCQNRGTPVSIYFRLGFSSMNHPAIGIPPDINGGFSIAAEKVMKNMKTRILLTIINHIVTIIIHHILTRYITLQ